jgi:MFS family permease
LRSIYYLAFIPGILAVVVSSTIKEKSVSHEAKKQKSWQSFFNLPSAYKNYLMAWFLFSVGNSSDIFLLLKSQQSGLSLTETILIYCCYNLFYALSSPSLGKLSDRWGRKKILGAGLVLFAFVYFCFSIADERWHFWSLFILYGIYMAATEGVGKAFAIDLLGEDQKATAVGYLGTITGLSAFFASATAGLLWDNINPKATFIFGAVCALCSALSLLRVRVQNK